MKHLGDITLIKGNEAPVVDCIVGGSPCQDLSLAGKRAGLAGARSGLYMEQIRIIKEMRENDRNHGRTGVDIRPRYMVWENVPGAFSTNQGQDFAAVLEEAIRVAEPKAPDVPVPEKGWPTAGCIVGEQWSVAWRVLDAQFWGTSDKPLPQRRRRIALVADFGGHSAPEILFVRKSVSGDLEPGDQKGKGASRQTQSGIGADGNLLILESNQNHATVQTSGICTTLPASMGMGGGYVPMVCEPTCYEMQAFGKYKDSGIASALKARDYKDATDLVVAGADEPICMDRAFYNQGKNALYEPQCYEDGTVPTLVAKGPAAVQVKHIVRRLTPLECERLQGFPDGWTDIGEWVDSNGKKHKAADSPRYKALGNSIALPPWKWVLKRLCACYERDATMASLFDGIGGFPLIWEQINGKGSCLWASEIEEFPIAVTKLRFRE